jgi:hypothetical protein
MQEPLVIERFADNGEHSHWVLVNDKGQEIASSQEDKFTEKELRAAIDMAREQESIRNGALSEDYHDEFKYYIDDIVDSIKTLCSTKNKTEFFKK